MTPNKYNGWYNYETWLFNLWFDGAFTEDAQNAWNEAEPCKIFTREENAVFSLSDTIKDYAEEYVSNSIDEVLSPAGFINDLINAALFEINYHEIAQHYIAEVDREETTEE